MADANEIIVEYTEPLKNTKKPYLNTGWKIALPDSLVSTIVKWYHAVLNHIGASRLYETISINFSHPSLRKECREVTKTCDACQRYKTQGRGYAHLPERETLAAPFFEVAVDLIGPWTITVNGQELVFHALTIIDTVTNLPEIARVDNKTSPHCARKFEITWLTRYPRPMRCIYDQGGEFIGRAFTAMLALHGIKRVPTTVKNPQANAICERMHLTAANALRILVNDEPPTNAEEAALLMDTALQTASYGIRTAVHGILKVSPGALVYQRDMLLDIPIISDLEVIRRNRQAAINHNLIIANSRRVSHDYAVKDKVLKLVYKPTKLAPRAKGPYEVVRVHANGTLTIQLTPTVTERINVRRVRPYFTPKSGN